LEVAPELRQLLQQRAQLTLAQVRDWRESPFEAHRVAIREPRPAPARDHSASAEALQCFNGYGGFAAGGSEYVVRLAWKDGRLALPPRPWTNVIANRTTGCIVSERGAGYTWSQNSRENRLTPWGTTR
jgi:cyclic beta-1,2-glucan synthetase